MIFNVENEEILDTKDRWKYRFDNLRICREFPEFFMICPGCNGSRLIYYDYNYAELCNYCNHRGVICWIDRILHGKKNPFTEGGI
jgi:hypothetical protein